jgi:hypothetical protein
MEDLGKNVGIISLTNSTSKLIQVFDYFYPFLAYMDMRSLSICDKITSAASSSYNGNKSGLPNTKIYLFGCNSTHLVNPITDEYIVNGLPTGVYKQGLKIVSSFFSSFN